jgi:hypothetical protein
MNWIPAFAVMTDEEKINRGFRVDVIHPKSPDESRMRGTGWATTNIRTKYSDF